MEVRDPVGAVKGRRQPVRPFHRRPARPGCGPDAEHPELVEGEGPVRTFVDRVLDPVQLRVEVRISGLLPRLGPLERHTTPQKQTAQGVSSDAYRAGHVASQVLGEFADRPAGEGFTEPARAGGGRLDDEVLVVLAEQAGTTSRPIGSRQASPISLKRWITSRTVSSSASTGRAITETVSPPAEASSIIARRNRTALLLPSRTTRRSSRSPCSVSLRALTSRAIPSPVPI